MRRILIALAVLACPPAPETEGASGAAPACLRLDLDRLRDLLPARPGELPWPGQDFWDRIGGVAPARRRMLPAFPPLPGGSVDLCFVATPFRHALAAVGRASGAAIELHRAVPPQIAATRVTLAAEGVSLGDALELLLMQVSPDGAVLYELLGDSILVCRR